MILDFAQLDKKRAYFTMIQTVIPRPIAWVLSENESGSYNLAPFSYFNAVCSDPPLVMISVGRRPDGTHKDTRTNIEARKSFVIHIAHRELLQAMNDSSAPLPPGESEVEKLGLKTAELPGSRLPRLAEPRIAMGCELFQIQELGETGQSIIFGKLESMYIDDAIAEDQGEGRLKVHADKLDPIGRLGAGEYVLFGDIASVPRPK